jgi:hypothetical protein
MKNSIAISDEEKTLLYNYLGQGTDDKKLIIFGNEPGLAGVEDLSEMINSIRKIEKVYWKTSPWNSDAESPFLLRESFAHPTTSEFARFVSRLELAVMHRDSRFLGELSAQGQIAINEHIFKSISEKHSSLINLRPLPRPTQDTWIYSNIDKKEYNKEWNFGLKRHYITPEGAKRAQAIKRFIDSPNRYRNEGILLGVGEKEHKKIFLESLFKEYDPFIRISLDSHFIYFHSFLNIVLCDYFNSRNGIKLRGLHELYNFLLNRKLI